MPIYSKAVMRAALGHHHRRGVILPFAVGPTEGVMDLQAVVVVLVVVVVVVVVVVIVVVVVVVVVVGPTEGVMDLQASPASPMLLPCISPASP